MDNTNRDQVLSYAMGVANSSCQVVIIYKGYKRQEWFWQSYGPVPGDADNSTVRYVLPNCEVTRLA